VNPERHGVPVRRRAGLDALAVDGAHPEAVPRPCLLEEVAERLVMAHVAAADPDDGATAVLLDDRRHRDVEVHELVGVDVEADDRQLRRVLPEVLLDDRAHRRGVRAVRLRPDLLDHLVHEPLHALDHRQRALVHEYPRSSAGPDGTDTGERRGSPRQGCEFNFSSPLRDA
jgi:hypothetical protein